MSFLDTLIYGYRTIQSAGSALTQRNVVNFVSGATVVDNSAQGRTDVTITATGGGTSGTGFVHTTAGVPEVAAIGETGTGNVVRQTTPTIKTSLKFNNPADTFAYTFVSAAIVADRILNLPLTAATDTLAVLDFAQAFTNKTMVAASNTITDTAAALGDLFMYNGTRFARLARGADTQVLQATATTIAWADSPIDPSTSGMRLTLTTALPVTSADVATATSVFLTPYTSGRLALYNGTRWIGRTTAEVTLAIGTLTSGKNYDVFAFDSAGTVTLELSAAWASDTARTDAIVRQDGVWCKSGTLTRRLVGTFRTISTTQTTDTVLQRYLWNANNAVSRRLSVTDANATWNYVNPNAVWRQTRSAPANRFEVVSGDVQYMKAKAYIAGSVSATTGSAAAGVGIDSTTVNSAQVYGGDVDALSSRQLDADYGGWLALGYHAINWLETGNSNVLTYTFKGAGGVIQTGMVGEVLA